MRSSQSIGAFERGLLTGLSDKQLNLIGQIATLWNNNERVFENLICRAAKWDADIGELVTADLQSVSRETLAKNVIELNVTNPTYKTYALTTVSLFTEARIKRNNLVHSLPTFDPAVATSTVGVKRSAKAGTGKIKTIHHNISAESLDDFVVTLLDLGTALYSAERMLRVSPSEPGDDWPIPPIDISQIQTLVDQLRSEHQNKDKS